MRSSRRLPALIGATALVTAALAGCTAAAGSGCDPVYDSGPSSKVVTASGAAGSPSKVDFPTPLVVTDSQVSVIDAGDGAYVHDGDQVDLALSVYFGADGQDIAGQVQKGRIAAGIDKQAISEALVCARVGDRLALTTTSEAAYGAGGGAAGNIQDSDTLVMVIDVLADYLGKANGFNQLPQDGMPSVATEVNGTPGVSVSLQSPPSTTRSSVIKAGEGAKIKNGDEVVSAVSIFTWADGDQPVFVSSDWDNQQAPTRAMVNFDQGGNLPAGVVKALVGQRIGSQVLIVLAPGDDSYPQDKAPADPTATYILVVDLLGIQK